MNRNLVLIGTVAAIAFAVAVAGVGDSSRAVACDKTAKAAAASSDCTKSGKAVAASVHAGCTSAAVAAASGCDKSKTAAAAAGADAGCRSKAAAAVAAAAGCDKSRASAVAAASGCDKSKASATAACAKACAKAKEARTAALKAAIDDIPYRENKRLVLTGSYACGKCTLEVTETCAPLFKTAEGQVYPLVRTNLTAGMRRADAGNGVEISTSVRKVEGIKYLEVKSYKTL